MKIFHGMSDIAGQGSYAVAGLRENGVESELVVFRKNSFGYGEDKCLNISKNPLLYPCSALKMLGFAASALHKYDIFHFHFSYSLLPYNLDLPVYTRLNKKIFMEYHGSEIRWNFYRVKPKYLPGNDLPLKDNRYVKAAEKIDKYVNGYILHDSELKKHLPSNNVDIYYIPLKMDVRGIKPYYPSEENKRPIIVHAPSDMLKKGSKYIIQAVENLKRKYDLDFILVHGKSHSEALEIYKKADIIVDQLFAGTYGVFSIEAMSMGKPSICYVSDDMIDEYPEELPIVNANIDNIESKLEMLLVDSALRREIGIKSRKFAENYHDYRKVAKALVEVYNGTYLPKTQREAYDYVKNLKEN